MEKLEQITIELTRTCPNRCIFCSSNSSSLMEEKLNLPDVKKILRDGKKLGLGKLILSGGEPFLYPNVADVIKFAEELSLEEIIIYTAGVMLSKKDNTQSLKPIQVSESKIQQVISANIPTKFTLSLNSACEKIHDSITGVEGSWQNAVSFLENAIKLKLEIDVHTVVVKQNYLGITDLRKFIKKKANGKKINLRLLRLVPQGRAQTKYEQLALNYHDWIQVKKQIESKSKNLCDIRLGAHIGTKIPNEYQCGLNKPKLLIAPDGHVSICPALKGLKRYSLSPNIKTMTLKKIVESDWRSNIASYKKSGRCYAQNIYRKPLNYIAREDKTHITDLLLLKCFSENIAQLGFNPLIEKDLAIKISSAISRLEGLHDLDEQNCLFQYNSLANRENIDRICDIRRLALVGAIHALKFNDLRENPDRHSIDKNKRPNESIDLPDTEELEKYMQALKRFEAILYGADQWYRDHDVHSFRVWLLGLYILFSTKNVKLLPPSTSHNYEIDNQLYFEEELLSAFSVAALTHDIGYPLEKLSNLNSELRSIYESFGGLDWQTAHSSYTLASHDAARNLLRHLRSKPVFKKFSGSDLDKREIEEFFTARFNAYKEIETTNQLHDKHYIHGWGAVLRSQTKFYDKYVDSLEKNDHGLISALLLQRKLTYFKESEFAFEEDYFFSLEEARQFLLRREILRAISTHTCKEIYLNNLLSLESFLFFCDEMQEWGRPYFSDLYEISDSWRKKQLWIKEYSENALGWEVSHGELSIEAAAFHALRFGRDFSNRLRTGPETSKRRFKIEVENTWSHKKRVFHHLFLADFTIGEPIIRSEVFSSEKSEKIDITKYVNRFKIGEGMQKVYKDLIAEFEKL